MNKIREIKKETKSFENLKIYATNFLKRMFNFKYFTRFPPKYGTEV